MKIHESKERKKSKHINHSRHKNVIKICFIYIHTHVYTWTYWRLYFSSDSFRTRASLRVNLQTYCSFSGRAITTDPYASNHFARSMNTMWAARIERNPASTTYAIRRIFDRACAPRAHETAGACTTDKLVESDINDIPLMVPLFRIKSTNRIIITLGCRNRKSSES